MADFYIVMGTFTVCQIIRACDRLSLVYLDWMTEQEKDAVALLLYLTQVIDNSQS